MAMQELRIISPKRGNVRTLVERKKRTTSPSTHWMMKLSSQKQVRRANMDRPLICWRTIFNEVLVGMNKNFSLCEICRSLSSVKLILNGSSGTSVGVVLE